MRTTSKQLSLPYTDKISASVYSAISSIEKMMRRALAESDEDKNTDIVVDVTHATFELPLYTHDFIGQHDAEALEAAGVTAHEPGGDPSSSV